MRTTILIALTILLTGCQTGSGTTQPTTKFLLENPLYAERYAEALVDAMVELDIQDHPLLEDKKKKSLVDDTRKEWLQKSKDARSLQRDGLVGSFIETEEYTYGEALYLNNILYFGPAFVVTPGPNVHVYLTKVVDPRDIVFPDESSIHLGEVISAFGAQQYNVPVVEEPLVYRTVVLWDTQLERILGFAQLSN